MNKYRIQHKMFNLGRIFRKAFVHFMDNRPVELAGTTAYFAIFSVAPILIIVIAVFGYLVGQSTVRDKLFEELTVLVGADSTSLLQDAIDNYRIVENSTIGTIIGLTFFLFFASTLFSVMQDSIDFIWRVKVRANLKMNLMKLAVDRLLSFGVIFSIGFILLVSLVVDAGITFMRDILLRYFPADFLVLVWGANLLLTLGIIMTTFALIFHFLPDVYVRWNASWFGAFFTAILFTLGKIVIGLLIGNSNLGAVYGAASSIVVLLMWIYYSALIFYFGVQLTCEFSRFYKHHNKPKNYAIPFRIHHDE
ncbi:YihY/virulence factor BrkB family protein [Mangrovibacterium lignilyticum]|uniref:YihY/virulence factor BrkB family protein n=1 Tax=Mangrovibacterium lignilyticum TaxID=2668052 RepID=UPI0013D8A34E|nr:YihY/virulence factor BrkB family protein [Mangrovibacterium lignilyticum]